MSSFQPITQIPVFLSSPGDVGEERRLALEVIERLNDDPAFRDRIVLKAIAWDKPGAGVPMEATYTPQEAINQGMRKPSTCAIVIVIFWSRMGTPLPPEYQKADGTPYLSGTEWEYVDAISAHYASTSDPKLPRVFVYRRTEEPKLGARDPELKQKLEQYERVESFFKRFTNTDGSLAGGVNAYTGPGDFEKQLEQHLRHWIVRLVGNYDPFALDEAQRHEQVARAKQQVENEAQRIQHQREHATYTKFINSLPQQDMVDRFRDRVKYQDTIVNSIKDGVPLVSVYGRGGIGKTALVCKVLGDLQRDHSTQWDGMVYLGAGSQSSTGISLERIVLDFLKLLTGEAKEAVDAAWREPKMSAHQKVGVLFDHLSKGRYLLLLDNLETLQDPVTHELTDPDLKAFFAVLFERGGRRDSGLRVLATSREQLNLADMRRQNEKRVPLVDGLPVEDAIQLLCDLDSDGEAGLKDSDASKLKIIAEKTGGFPRALEAVYALLRTPRMTLDRLVADPVLLSGKVRDLVEEAIQRLDPDSLRAMEALAVYGRPLSQTGLEYLLAPYLESATLPGILDRLVSGYFVSFNKASGLYALHPIDQEFCAARVPEGSPLDKPISSVSVELAELRRSLDMEPPTVIATQPSYSRYALLYRAADYHRTQRSPQKTWKKIEDLDPQLLEFEYRVQVGDYDSAANLLRDIDFDYLLLWGHAARVIALHEQLLGHIQHSHLAERSIGTLGSAYRRMGRLHDASRCYEQALEIARHNQDQQGEGVWLGNLGAIYSDLGQILYGIDYYQQALAISRQTKNRSSEGINLGNLGIAYCQLGKIQQGIECFQQMSVIAHALGDRISERLSMSSLGEAYYRSGQVQQAIDYHQQALAIAREIGDRNGEGNDLGNFGDAQSRIGQHTEAITNLKAALTIANEVNSPQLKNFMGGYLALALLVAGDLPAAREAAITAQQFDVPENNHGVAALRGLIHARLGEQEMARSAFADAVRFADMILNLTPNYYDALYARGLGHAGLVLIEGAAFDPAIADYRAARAICDAVGVVDGQLRLLDALMTCPGGERLALVRAALAGAG